jgi:hypothetical protein
VQFPHFFIFEGWQFAVEVASAFDVELIGELSGGLQTKFVGAAVECGGDEGVGFGGVAGDEVEVAFIHFECRGDGFEGAVDFLFRHF